jgi:putative two-component system response regulator
MHVAVLAPNTATTAALANLAAALGDTETHRFTSHHAALGHCSHRAVDLVVLGHPLPGALTANFMRNLRGRTATEHTAVVMVADHEARELRADAFAQGADEFAALPLAGPAFADLARAAVTRRAAPRAPDIADHLQDIETALAQRTTRERELFFKLLATLVGHDGETTAHCLRVGFYSRAIATGLGVDPTIRDTLALTGPLHDIGKVLVAPEVLNKRGRFNPSELAAMRAHPAAGRRLLSGSRLPLLQEAAELAGTHHERWDGRGYPDGVSGADIPLTGRIVAIADVFDALVSDRSYKRAWTPGQAIDQIISCSGTQFDPDCVRAFCERWEDILAVKAAFDAGGAAADAFLQRGLRAQSPDGE